MRLAVGRSKRRTGCAQPVCLHRRPAQPRTTHLSNSSIQRHTYPTLGSPPRWLLVAAGCSPNSFSSSPSRLPSDVPTLSFPTYKLRFSSHGSHRPQIHRVEVEPTEKDKSTKEKLQAITGIPTGEQQLESAQPTSLDYRRALTSYLQSPFLTLKQIDSEETI